MNFNGEDKTEAFNRGVSEALFLANNTGICAAFLKEKSPSCGVSFIYDGFFRGKLISGQGLFARALIAEEIPVFSSDHESSFRDFLNEKNILF